MNQKIHTAGQGITLLYYAQMLVLASSICTIFISLWSPLERISSILISVGLIFSLVGLFITAKTHTNFKIALACTLLNIVLSLTTIFFALTSYFPILSSCANVLVIITSVFVVLGTKQLCDNKAVHIKSFNKFVIMIYFCIFLLVACVNIIYALNIVDLKFAGVITSCVTFLGNFCYVHLLNRARKVLK